MEMPPVEAVAEVAVTMFDETYGSLIRHWSGPANQLLLNIKPGQRAHAGLLDLKRQRIDVQSDAPVENILPQPSPHHEWDVQVWDWIDRGASQLAALQAEIERIERGQQRAMREHALGIAAGTAKLVEINTDIVTIRDQVTAIKAARAELDAIK